MHSPLLCSRQWSRDFSVKIVWKVSAVVVFLGICKASEYLYKQNETKEKVLEWELPQGTSKFWAGGFYKTTYYAIQLKKKAVAIATPTSNGSYATSEIQSTFLQQYVDQYGMLWKVLCTQQFSKGKDACSNNQTYLWARVVVYIYNKMFLVLIIYLRFFLKRILPAFSKAWPVAILSNRKGGFTFGKSGCAQMYNQFPLLLFFPFFFLRHSLQECRQNGW